MSKSIAGQTMITSFKDLIPTDSRGNSEKDPIKEITLESLVPFKNHPFRVKDDEEMQKLVESIKAEGVINPILVRDTSNNQFEIISGHRRKRACELAGIKTIPAIVRKLTDDEATILMVDSNLHRENILPSERAFALKMKMQACNNQGFRSDLTSGQKVQKLKKEKVEENEGISGRQIRRYIRLTELNRELLDLVDKGKIPLTAANELSSLDKETQDWMCRAISANKGKLSIKKAKALRKAFETGKLDPVKACNIILANKTKNPGEKTKDVAWNKENNKYISFSYSELEEIYHDLSHPDNVKRDILHILRVTYKVENPYRK